MNTPRFSLVMATLGRTREPERFLESLAAQNYANVQLIAVDQNPDDRLVEILRSFESRFGVLHLRSAPGLSRARNVALPSVDGDVVAFPDDDCQYPPGLLHRIADRLAAQPAIDGLTGRSADPTGASTTITFHEQGGRVTRFNVWRRGISFTIFLRRKVVDAVGPFDDTLGVGSATPWGAGEENDYLLRAMSAGFRLEYDPTLAVLHANPHRSFDDSTLARAESYGRGLGRVLRKHRFSPLFCLYPIVALPLIRYVACTLKGQRGKARHQLATLRGRWAGYRAPFQ